MRNLQGSTNGLVVCVFLSQTIAISNFALCAIARFFRVSWKDHFCCSAYMRTVKRTERS